ncbi:Protein kinase domain-containing protein [Caenorhabditis elegans]|uniref:Protein kinase domain-containing protein n=1 Tax=Caenorhabditis elegans TaxID=6239 RepID=G5EC33_CAEEL|nr:Protein kinase domain-containing protein [Caenorhabditis elegans]CAA83602.2 Protein kinase domain-containing protein [Caenorhabditis elegans]|eukprot:NP_497900.2 Uncharacterized protein CELE_C28A5.6 [Caenorhabditis elegans]
MDFPFEYVERAITYPSFDRKTVCKAALNKRKKKTDLKGPKCLESEEDELDGDLPEIVIDEKEKALLKEIQKFELEVKKGTTNKYSSSSEFSSSNSDACDSDGETSDTDAVEAMFKNENDATDIAWKRLKIMRQCCCSGSDCFSDKDLDAVSASSSSHLISEEDGEVGEKKESEQPTDMVEPSSAPTTEETETENEEEDDKEKTDKEKLDAEKEKALAEKRLEREQKLYKDLKSSSDDTSSSIDDKMNFDDEIEYLEEMLDNIEKQKDRKGSKDETEDTDATGDEEDSMFEEVKSASNKSGAEKSSAEQTSNAGVETSFSQSYSSTTDTSSAMLDSESIIITSSDPDADNADLDRNIEKFNWDSDDLYRSTDTDSEVENLLDYLSTAMNISDKVFSEFMVVGEETTPLLKEKLKTFQLPMPRFLKNTKYEMMEELDPDGPISEALGNNPESNSSTSNQFWLVQNIKSGCMCSAKLVSRKNPEHLQLQKNLDKERKILYDLLPELSNPSHIARLVDIGYDDDFKFLIFEDFGMDLLTLFDEFGAVLNPTTMFLISYFTFNAIKELHSFDIVHLDIRPSSFSVNQHPFNIKITDYSRCMTRKPEMKVPDDARPDSFSPRVFHQKDAQFDEFVDFEAWVYTMLFLCTAEKLPWFGDAENMFKLKEVFFNDPLNYLYDGCADFVPLVACFIANKKLTYETFMEKMNLIFSVDVMQYSDKEQPRLYTMKELEEVKKTRRAPDFYTNNAIDLVEGHWHAADESDHDNLKASDEENEQKSAAARKSKSEKKKDSCERSSAETSSCTEQTSSPMSEASSSDGRKKPKKAGKSAERKEKSAERNPSSEKDDDGATEAMIGVERRSTPSDVVKNKKGRAKGDPEKQKQDRKENKTEEEKSKLSEPPKPKPGRGKKVSRGLITREFLLGMRHDFTGTQSAMTGSYDSTSATSLSTWTSSTCATDEGEEKRKFKWSLKSEEDSEVEFFEDLDQEEREHFRNYENLVALSVKDEVALSSGSEVEPLSDIDSEENLAIIKRLEKREMEIGWEVSSEREKTTGDRSPDDQLDKLEAYEKK